VQRNPTSGQYQIGMEFYRLASKAQSSFAIRNAGIPVMQDLVAQCNETAFLGLYDVSRMEMMFVAAVNSNHPLRYIVPINEWIPVYAGASGLAIMAFLPEDERQAIIKRTRLTPLTEHTISHPAALEDEFARVRARGYAFSRGHRNVGAVAIAAPIWSPNGRVIGDLVLSMPESRFDEKMEPTLARLIIQASESAQIWVVTHSPALIAGLLKGPGAKLIELQKEMGQTHIKGQDLLSRPQWKWVE
jgi:IclR family acetate operon transcriptional repressor